jgi:hypothetical protein
MEGSGAGTPVPSTVPGESGDPTCPGALTSAELQAQGWVDSSLLTSPTGQPLPL